jgi:hypothetical protein
MTETELSHSAISALRSLGALCERVHSGQAFGRSGGFMQCAPPGTPDWLVVYRGRVNLLEFKTADGELSPAQLEWHARALRNGVRVLVIRSVEGALREVRGA